MQEATFQLVLTSDGTNTFVFYIYGINLMNWKTDKSDPEIWIGYAANGSHLETNLNSFKQPVLKMDRNAYHKGNSFV